MNEANRPTHVYIRRRGRLTKAQARGLQAFEERFRAQVEQVNQQSKQQPVGIEIGFGMGQALLDWAEQDQHMALFGIELYQPGIGALADALCRREIANVAILEIPAEDVFVRLSAASVSEVRIFFPDPWPKKRHHKRRLIQPAFVAQLERVLKPGGVLRIATDWQPYAEWIDECLGQSDLRPMQAEPVSAAGALRPTTKFEARGVRLGHDIRDFVYTRD